MGNFRKVDLKEIDPREILGPIAHIYRSNVAYMAKELDAYEADSLNFYCFCTTEMEYPRKPLQKP